MFKFDSFKGGWVLKNGDSAWYLKKAHTDYKLESLDLSQKEKLLWTVAKGFFDSETNIYVLVEIAGYIWDSLSDEERSSSFGDLCEKSQELAYDLHDEDKSKSEDVTNTLNQVKSFYTEWMQK